MYITYHSSIPLLYIHYILVPPLTDFRITKPYIKIVCRSDGRLTGEAYIRFDSRTAAQDALKHDKKEIGKRYVELFVVDPSEADHVLSI